MEGNVVNGNGVEISRRAIAGSPGADGFVSSSVDALGVGLVAEGADELVGLALNGLAPATAAQVGCAPMLAVLHREKKVRSLEIQERRGLKWRKEAPQRV